MAVQEYTNPPVHTELRGYLELLVGKLASKIPRPSWAYVKTYPAGRCLEMSLM